ncbi:hypothetical protein [Phaeobacter phage MD18]|nr:hypothetical protein [Phaeobacter phage MD18]
MLYLLLSSVASSAINAVLPGVRVIPAIPHSAPMASYWRLRLVGGKSSAAFVLGSIEFRDAIGGANIATGGTPLASGELAGFEKANAFDGSSATSWKVARPPSEAWIGYHFSSPVSVREVALLAASPDNSESPVAFLLEYSSDAISWNLMEVFHAPSDWSSADFPVGSGAIDTSVVYGSGGGVTSLPDEVIGNVYQAEQDFTITRVHLRLNANRYAHAAILAVRPGTYEITEVIAVSEPSSLGGTMTLGVDPSYIRAGEHFAVVAFSAEQSSSKNIAVRKVDTDHHPGIATPVGSFLQPSKDLSVGAVPSGASETGNSLISFEAVYRNGVGSFPSGHFRVPGYVPIPSGWYSPEEVTVDGNGVVTSIANLGWRGPAHAATPESGKEVTIASNFRFWGDRPVFVVGSMDGGYVLGAGGFPAQSFMSVATYGPEESPRETFADYAAYVSGAPGASNELELVGHFGAPYFFNGKADYIVVGDGYYNGSARDPVLPFQKTALGAMDDTDGLNAGMLWRDNFSAARSWEGTSGDILIFEQKLSKEQLLRLGQELERHFDPVPEVTAFEVGNYALLGGGGGDNISAPKADGYIIHGGGGVGNSSAHTHNVYVLITE